MTNILNGIYKRDQLWLSKLGRDYIKIDNEIYSINGIYCDQHGNHDRWGHYVKIMDVRWPVVTISPHDGVLRYSGDSRDRLALEHWGFTLLSDRSVEVR